MGDGGFALSLLFPRSGLSTLASAGSLGKDSGEWEAAGAVSGA
jgi:hypothetical protein